MKEKPTKAKKKGRTIRAFKRDISLWLFCVPGVILTFIFSYIPMYGVQIGVPPLQCDGRNRQEPVGRHVLLREILQLSVLCNYDQEHVDPESVRTDRIIPDSDHPGTDAELLPS